MAISNINNIYAGGGVGAGALIKTVRDIDRVAVNVKATI